MRPIVSLSLFLSCLKKKQRKKRGVKIGRDRREGLSYKRSRKENTTRKRERGGDKKEEDIK